MHSQNIYLIVVYHKKHFTLKNTKKLFIPIHAGKKISKINLNILGDNTGNNISYKNPNYSELTATYWIWKNVDAKYYGIMHYRRYFTINKKTIKYKLKQIYFNLLKNLGLDINFNNNQNIKDISAINNFYKNKKIINNYDIIIPKKWYFSKTVKEQYIKCHIEKNWLTLDKTLKDMPKYYKYFKMMEKNNWIYPYNMFIMKKKYFKEYMKWQFSIFNKLEKKIIISKNDYQQRVFAFLGERLFTLYILYLRDKKNINIKELPVLYLDK